MKYIVKNYKEQKLTMKRDSNAKKYEKRLLFLIELDSMMQVED